MRSTSLRALTLCALALAGAQASAHCLDLRRPEQYRLPTLREEAKGADAVVVGKVIAVDAKAEDASDPQGWTSFIYTVAVEERLYGSVPATIMLRAGNDSRGYRMAADSRHVLVLQRRGDLYYVDPCGNSEDLARKPEALDRVRSGIVDAVLLAALDDAKELEFFSLEPADGEGSIAGCTGRCLHGWPVLGAVRVTGRLDKSALMRELEAWITAPEPAAAKLCFEPRHAVRVITATRHVDFVICFACGNAQVFEGSTKDPIATLGAERSPKAWNQLLSKLGLRLAKPPRDD